jgi:hypothetical protein
MEISKFAKLANYSGEKDGFNPNKRLSKALDTLSELLNIEFGSLTVHFHKGKWSPKIEIQKSVFKEIDK